MDFASTEESKTVWKRVYNSAAWAFSITQGLLLLMMFVLWASLQLEGGVSAVLYKVGLLGLFFGLYLVIATGLFSAGRWAAVLATLWGAGLIAVNALYFTIGRPLEGEDGLAAAATAVGAACPGTLNLLSLIFAVRAVVAKRRVIDSTTIVAMPVEYLNPYGQVIVKERLRGVVPRVFLFVGIMMAAAGSIAIAMAFWLRHHTFMP